MTEWTVVTVIIALVGLITVVMKPILNLIAAITRLGESVDTLEKQLSKIVDKNSEAHARMWRNMEKQEKRIIVCEAKLGKKRQYEPESAK